MSMGGALITPHIFWSLKKRTRTYGFNSNEPSPDLLEPLGRYDHPWGKENRENKHASVIFLLAKNTEFHIFADRSKNVADRQIGDETSTIGFSDELTPMV